MIRRLQRKVGICNAVLANLSATSKADSPRVERAILEIRATQ